MPFAENFIRGLQAARDLQAQQQEMEERAEERDFQRKYLKWQQDRLTLQDRLERQMQSRNMALGTGQMQAQADPLAPLRQRLTEQQATLQGMPLPAGPEGQTAPTPPPTAQIETPAPIPRQAQYVPVTLPAVEGMAPETQVEIPYAGVAQEQAERARIMQKIRDLQATLPFELAKMRAQAGLKPEELPAPEWFEIPGSKEPIQSSWNKTTKQWEPPLPPGAKPFKPISTSTSAEDIQDAANMIYEGLAVPILSNYSFRDRTAITAALRRKGDFNLARAESDWKAVQKHLSTLNGPQQERLRQVITFTYDSLDIIDDLYKQWQATGLPGGYKEYNKAALWATAQASGKSGAIAQSLKAQINDLVSELGTVYKGGNASTDESLKLAAENLKAEWNQKTFEKALGLIRENLRIRKNSILTSQPFGVTPGSPYLREISSEPKKSDPLGIR